MACWTERTDLTMAVTIRIRGYDPANLTEIADTLQQAAESLAEGAGVHVTGCDMHMHSKYETITDTGF